MTVKFRTAQLEHEFGCPYQLGHHRYANNPCDADLAALPVCAGDVIVMGSDGLLDNLSETEMVAEVSKLLAGGAKPGAMAQRIAKVWVGDWCTCRLSVLVPLEGWAPGLCT
jgi:protein phosphatase PTC7